MTFGELLKTKGQDGDFVILSYSNFSKDPQLIVIYPSRNKLTILETGLMQLITSDWENLTPLVLLRANLRPGRLLQRVIEGPLCSDVNKIQHFDIGFEIIWKPEESKYKSDDPTLHQLLSKVFTLEMEIQHIKDLLRCR